MRAGALALALALALAACGESPPTVSAALLERVARRLCAGARRSGNGAARAA